MSFITNIINRFRNDSKAVIPKDYSDELSNSRSKKKGSIRVNLRQRTYRIEADLRKWKSAVTSAEDKMRPDRQLLYQLYHVVMEDDHLLSQVRTARFSIQMAPFQISINKKVQEDLKQLFDTPWFFDLLEICMDTELYGHSVVEFVDKDEDNRIKSIYLVPRDHVKPERKIIVLDPADEDGLLYEEKPLNKQLLAIGKTDNLGLLKSISKAVIRKEFNITDWGRRNERFGMPFVVVRTASTNDAEIDEKARMLENFGSNMWAILDDEDQLDIKEPISSTGGGHLSYLSMTEYIDKSIAFMVNGQTGTSDEKSYAGSSEVHERVLNKYTLARLKRIQNWINFYLIPFLTKYHDYPLTGAKFDFLDLLEEQEKPDVKDTKPKDIEDPVKKKAN